MAIRLLVVVVIVVRPPDCSSNPAINHDLIQDRKTTHDQYEPDGHIFSVPFISITLRFPFLMSFFFLHLFTCFVFSFLLLLLFISRDSFSLFSALTFFTYFIFFLSHLWWRPSSSSFRAKWWRRGVSWRGERRLLSVDILLATEWQKLT